MTEVQKIKWLKLFLGLVAVIAVVAILVVCLGLVLGGDEGLKVFAGGLIGLLIAGFVATSGNARLTALEKKRSSRYREYLEEHGLMKAIVDERIKTFLISPEAQKVLCLLFQDNKEVYQPTDVERACRAVDVFAVFAVGTELAEKGLLVQDTETRTFKLSPAFQRVLEEARTPPKEFVPGFDDDYIFDGLSAEV